MSSGTNVPNLQKNKIIEYLESGKRFDGRGVGDYRDMEVETGISNHAESSVRLRVGKTEVLAGVKMEVVTPYPDSPNDGTFMTSMELHPMASQEYEMGRPGIDSIEMSRIIDRGIRESGFIDFGKLCIKEGEKVWQIFLDIVALNDDGNMMDVAALASIIALGNARLPVYNVETNKVEHEFTDTPLPLRKEAMSFNMTVYKIGDKVVLDPMIEEELIASYRLSVAVADNDGEPRITAMQKGGSGSVSSEDLNMILDLIVEKWREMFPKVKKYVWGE